MLLVEDFIKSESLTQEDRIALAEGALAEFIVSFDKYMTEDVIDKLFSNKKPLSEGQLLNSIFPKHPTFIECEKIIDSYRSNSGKTINYMNEYNTLSDVSEKLSRHFNGDINIMSIPTGFATLMAKSTETKVALFDYNAFSITTHATYIRNFFHSADTLIDVRPDRIAFKSDVDDIAKFMLIGYSSELLFDDKITSGENMGIILHEIGHNFFLKSVLLKFITLLALPVALASNLVMLISKLSYIMFGRMDKDFFNSIVNPILLIVNDINKIVAMFKNPKNVHKLGDLNFIGMIRDRLQNKSLEVFDKIIANIISGFAAVAKTMNLATSLTNFVSLIEAALKRFKNVLEYIFKAWMSGFQTEEKFADDFATVHGYGQEIASIQVKLNQVLKAPTSSQIPSAAFQAVPGFMKDINAYLDNLTLYIERLDPNVIFDPHPSALDRQSQVLRNYDNAIAMAKSPEVKKKLTEQRKRIVDKLTEQRMNFLANQREIKKVIEFEGKKDSYFTSFAAMLQSFFDAITPRVLEAPHKTIASLVASIGR